MQGEVVETNARLVGDWAAVLWILNAQCPCGKGLVLSTVLWEAVEPEKGRD